jgi:hypothetical protein
VSIQLALEYSTSNFPYFGEHSISIKCHQSEEHSIKVQNSDLFRIEKIFQIFAIVQEGKLKEPYISHPIN